jgi:hypothetical protein
MLMTSASQENHESPFTAVAEGAWALQADHDRFSFRPLRADDDPSRVAWVRANNLWQAKVRARKAVRANVY